MIRIHYKGKGIVVIIYAIVPPLVLLLLTKGVEVLFFTKALHSVVYSIILSISFFISGIWTYLTAGEYYIDEDGDRQYQYFVDELMFIDMRVYSYVFWAFSGFIFLGSLVDLGSMLFK